MSAAPGSGPLTITSSTTLSHTQWIVSQAYGAFGVTKNVAAVTPGAGFTEISEEPSGEDTLGDLQAQWATNLNTILASLTNLNAGALGIEIKARSN